jgi:hypothetical protein
MTQQKPEDHGYKADLRAKAGRNANLTGRDNINNTNIYIPLFIIGIVALGGLAWALTVGLNNHGQNPQSGQPQLQQPQSTP